jgi:hypothetical protein
LKIIKTIIKLAVLAVAANATWHFFLAYSGHYKLRDTARGIAQNRREKTDEQLHDEIVAAAEEIDVPVPVDGVVVTHEGLTTTISASYSRTIEVLPNKSIDWPFSFRVDTFPLQSPNSLSLPK